MGEILRCPECGENISEFSVMVIIHCLKEHNILLEFSEVYFDRRGSKGVKNESSYYGNRSIF